MNTSTDQSANVITKEDVQSYVDTRKEACIGLVMRQTDYDRETTIQKLEANHYQYMKVIEEYMGIEKRQHQIEPKSLNQRKFKEIRDFMDNASTRYYKKKEYMEKRGYTPAFVDKKDASGN